MANLKRRPKDNPPAFLEHGKIPPQAIELEVKILGAMIMNHMIAKRMSSIMKPENFYKEDHSKIFACITGMVKENQQIDQQLIIEKLKAKELLDTVGGAYYVIGLSNTYTGGAGTEYYARIVQQKYFQREVIRIGFENIQNAFDDSVDVFDLIENMIDQTSNIIKDYVNDESESAQSAVAKAKMGIHGAISSEVADDHLITQCGKFDANVRLRGSNVFLVGGKSGSGKTRFIIFLISRILLNNEKISVKWYGMEDPAEKIVNCMVGSRVLLTIDQMHGKEHLSDRNKLDIAMSEMDRIDQYDIDFKNKPAYIDDIMRDWRYFCDARTDRFCILVIDNIMTLLDNSKPKERYLIGRQTAIDDYIAAGITGTGIKTDPKKNKLIVMAHHYGDDQMQESNLKEAYRPREKHLKGSTRIRDASTIISLSHKPDQYPDLVNDFSQYKQMMRNLFVLDTVKNRDGKLGYINFWTDLGLTYFKEI